MLLLYGIVSVVVLAQSRHRSRVRGGRLTWHINSYLPRWRELACEQMRRAVTWHCFWQTAYFPCHLSPFLSLYTAPAAASSDVLIRLPSFNGSAVLSWIQYLCTCVCACIHSKVMSTIGNRKRIRNLILRKSFVFYALMLILLCTYSTWCTADFIRNDWGLLDRLFFGIYFITASLITGACRA